MRTRRSDPTGPGWARIRHGRGHRYLDERGEPLTDEARQRILSLAIPPAWTDVWVCPDERGHIQATGLDQAGRRQYIYHPAWRQRQDRLKYDRMLQLAERLPHARRHATRDMRSQPGTRERALGAAFRLLDSAHLRVGNENYARQHGSIGLTTLQGQHATISGDTVTLAFPGKSGIDWDTTVTDPDLATVIRGLKQRGPTAPLLAHRNGNGNDNRRNQWRALTPTDVNDYVRHRVGDGFTSKDFRTLHGTIIAARHLATAKPATTQTAQKRTIADAVRAAADALGNTPAIARGSYIDPRIFDRYRAGETLNTAIAPERALRELLN